MIIDDGMCGTYDFKFRNFVSNQKKKNVRTKYRRLFLRHIECNSDNYKR